MVFGKMRKSFHAIPTVSTCQSDVQYLLFCFSSFLLYVNLSGGLSDFIFVKMYVRSLYNIFKLSVVKCFTSDLHTVASLS